jgi:hypothetical protein
MFKHLVSSVVGAAALALAGSASAATYISQLEYKDGSNTAFNPSFGQVQIEDGLDGGNRVRVTVTLNNALSEFVDTGGGHYAFAFNLADTPNSTTAVITSNGNHTYLGESAYKVSGFVSGNNTATFFKNAFECCGQGASNDVMPPFVFDVINTSGITFAGIGATVDGNGRLIGLGSGNRFASTTLGWWFAADIYDGATGGTYNVAAKDAFLVNTPVPEPTTWALMIMGFGGAGAVLRRQRRVAIA